MVDDDESLVAGVDLGSTSLKILVSSRDATHQIIEQVATPWRPGPGGTTSMNGAELVDSLRRLLERTATRIEGEPVFRGRTVGALAFAGMGETGFLIDDQGDAAIDGFAWFDPRGAAEAAALPGVIRQEFAGRTGLPLGAQVSVAKLLHLRSTGVELRGYRWVNVPEFAASTIGARVVAEYSLTSRTGLIDQDAGAAWPELLDLLAVREGFLPELVDAGADIGRATASWLPPPFLGARVTVAGHDYLVSAVASGEARGDRYHVSMGTAEVLLRMLDEPLDRAARARLAEYFINTVRHVVPGRQVLVAGVKTGLLMRRALRLAGIVDRAGRDRLDADVMARPLGGQLPPGGLEITGARNDDGVLGITVRADEVDPAELFGAILRHGNDEIQILIDAMDKEVAPATSALLTGGWAGMASVQRARAAVLPGLIVSERSQDTAYGAALFASRLLWGTDETALAADHTIEHRDGTS